MLRKNPSYKNRYISTRIFLYFLAITVMGTVFGQTVLIESGTPWRYLDDGSDQGTAWRDPGFNDSPWATGPAQLGYGDGDEATVISYGPNPGNKYITYYFRYSFNVYDPSQPASLLLRLLRDDGAVVYLNGNEIERSNMPSGTINYLTLSSSTVSGGEENQFFESYETLSNLVVGTNVIAVEIHQRSTNSSDISFDLQLTTASTFPDITHKAPYLIYTGVNTEMKVLWQLTVTDTSTIAWGTDISYSTGSAQTYEYGNDHQHTYTITNLIPGTKYYYRVSVNQEIHTGSFRSAPADDTTAIKFFAYGDTRSNPGVHNQVAAAIVASFTEDEESQTMILASGDLVNNGNYESDWDNQFFDPSYTHIQEMLASLPFQPCMGNHEGAGILFKKYFPSPFVAGRYWSFDYGPAHFVVVDQYVPYGPGSAQLNWIEDDLATTDKPWKFMYLHEPGWSAGSHGNNSSVQNYIQPLCEEYNVSILFTGHNHNYARAIVNGVQHVTTGGGGAPLYQPNSSYPNIVAVSRSYHYCKIEINDNILSFTAMTPSGNVIDSFTIENPEVGIAPVEDTVPSEFVFNPAFPNPFNQTTTISFSIPETNDVEMSIYNIQGQKITTLVNTTLKAGYHTVSWNGKNDLGQNVGSGIYIYKLQAGINIQNYKVLLLK